MSPFHISELAYKDLSNIWNYTYDHWSPAQADRYFELIIDEINYLAIHPEHGQSYEHIRIDYKASKVKSHLIFYKINEEKIVEIIRILHEKMDIENRL